MSFNIRRALTWERLICTHSQAICDHTCQIKVGFTGTNRFLFKSGNDPSDKISKAVCTEVNMTTRPEWPRHLRAGCELSCGQCLNIWSICLSRLLAIIYGGRIWFHLMQFSGVENLPSFSLDDYSETNLEAYLWGQVNWFVGIATGFTGFRFMIIKIVFKRHVVHETK